MYILRRVIKNKSIFKAPKPNTPPPFGIRMVLLLTCTGVSYSHGSNDGQKGVGLIMLILIALAPNYFAINTSANLPKIKNEVSVINNVLLKTTNYHLTKTDSLEVKKLQSIVFKVEKNLNHSSFDSINLNEKLQLKADITLLNKEIDKLTKTRTIPIADSEKKDLKSAMVSIKSITEYAPNWVIFMISISLGLGTMIGWKRIVTTIGEKIGKQQLNYAQGASSELVAAATIGMATAFGLPVSTTQVLSSGIAGSMVASKGVKNLQAGTIKNIAIAWVLTLPVTILLAGFLFILFRTIAG
jgi:PiT family inorganic phosphate transporter